MTDQDANEKMFYNIVTNPDVESRNQFFDLESMGETKQNLFCVGSEGPKWTPNNDTKYSINAPP